MAEESKPTPAQIPKASPPPPPPGRQIRSYPDFPIRPEIVPKTQN